MACSRGWFPRRRDSGWWVVVAVSGSGRSYRSRSEKKGNRPRAHASASNAPTTPIRSVFRGPSRASCRSLRSYQCRFLHQLPVRPRLFPSSSRPADFPPDVRARSFSIPTERRERFVLRPRESRAHTCARVCMYATLGDRK